MIKENIRKVASIALLTMIALSIYYIGQALYNKSQKAYAAEEFYDANRQFTLISIKMLTEYNKASFENMQTNVKLIEDQREMIPFDFDYEGNFRKVMTKLSDTFMNLHPHQFQYEPDVVVSNTQGTMNILKHAIVLKTDREGLPIKDSVCERFELEAKNDEKLKLGCVRKDMHNTLWFNLE